MNQYELAEKICSLRAMQKLMEAKINYLSTYILHGDPICCPMGVVTKDNNGVAVTITNMLDLLDDRQEDY